MTLHLHHFRGCAPAPLAHYLKALGVLRIVAHQKDFDVRGFWRDEHFCLLTSLDRSALERFFLEEYQPTPFVSPWNKGSGFYAAKDPALAPLENSTAPRFAPFRAGIAASRGPLADITQADKEVRRLKELTKKKKGMTAAQVAAAAALKLDPVFKAQLATAEREFKRRKADLYAPFALSWRGEHRDWLDAAMVLSDDGTPTWPSLLGTGGNDGRLDFTNNAMQRIAELFDVQSPSGAPRPEARRLLENAFWASATLAMQTAAVGQYLPGSAGGANGSTGADARPQVNPWDFVLMLEGALLFRGQATRRLDSRAAGQAAVPFAVRAHAAGHGTRGREKTERGEQWMPLWGQPAGIADVESLLGEGRIQLKRTNAQRPLDFARALAKLGIARGLDGFQRYGYLERNGQSKIAVPLGRIAVRVRLGARLIDDIGDWLERLQRLVRDGDAPSRLEVAEGAVADAAFTVLTTHDAPPNWQALLIAAAKVEALQVTGTGFEAGPMPRLSPGWLAAADDGSAEWRLAAALGSAVAGYKRGRAIDPVRAHVLPLAKGRYATSEKRLVNDPRVVMTGRDVMNDLIALVERRIVEATQCGKRFLPLFSRYRSGARLADLAAFLEGQVDVGRVVWLARALMALDWEEARLPAETPESGPADIDEAWMSLRLCGTPFSVAERRVPIDLAMIRRLTSGDATGAVSIALRRLSAAGYRPPIQSATSSEATARRWAAALAFPIAPTTAARLAARFRPSTNRSRKQMETS